MPLLLGVSVIGGLIEIIGHKKCLSNVDNLIVIPNRVRIMQNRMGGK